MALKAPTFSGLNAQAIAVGTLESTDATSVQVDLGDDAGDDFIVDTNKLVVEGDTGRVGIGTATPASTLEIESSSGDLILEMDNNAANSANFQIQNGAGNSRVDLVTNALDGGNPASLVNTTITMKAQKIGLLQTNPAYTLDVTGNGNFTSDLTVGGDVVISGTTPKLTIGDAGAEDTMLVFDGNAADFRIGIADGSDTLEIGKGSTHGTTTAIKVDSGANLQLLLNSAVADGEFSGDLAVLQAGEDLTAGELVYFKTDGKCWKAVATAAATSRCVAMATATISADAMGAFLLKGFARFNSEFPTWTVGGVLYTPEAETSGKNVAEQAAPDTDGDFVQVVGWAVSADAVYFNPSSTVIEVA